MELLHGITRAELDRAAKVAARAMVRYPVFAHVIPAVSAERRSPAPASVEPRHRRDEELYHVLRFLLGIALVQGEIVAPSRDIEAIAIWVRSENMHLSNLDVLRAGFAMLPLRIGIAATRRLLAVGKRKHAERAKILQGRYCLLDMLAVEPRQQGNGYGRILIESKLADADRNRARCYLETSDARNIGYYLRFGFRVIHEYNIADVPVYCLLRGRQAE